MATSFGYFEPEARSPLMADFVEEVAEEIGVNRGDDYYSNVGAARSCRSLQLERRL